MPQYFTHDHYGRPLTPAVEDLLRSTVIPVPKSMSRSKRTGKHLHIHHDNLRPSLLRNASSLSPLSPPELTTLSVYSVGSSLSEQMADGEETMGDDFDMESLFDDALSLSFTSRPLLHSLFSLSRSDNNTFSASEDADIQQDSFFSQYSPPPDDDSSSFNGSYFSIPSTWDESLSGYNRRRISRPIPTNSGDNHPLGEADTVIISTNTIEKKPTQNKMKSMVSNLTASLRTLTSVAQSFSEAQESLYASRTRTIKSNEPNPILMNKPKTDQSSNQLIESTDNDNSAPISLKTYRIQSSVIPQARQRDFRMNSDFYRIYALETLMRLNGKLDAEFRGRAQMILTPRQDFNHYLFDDDDDIIEGIYGIRRRLVSSRKVKEKQNTRRPSPLALSS